MGNLGWEMPGHKINWRNLFNNRFTHTNQERFIYKYYEGYQFAEQYSVQLQSRLWQSQLDGEHLFFGKHLQANWNFSYNKVTRTNSDDRLITGGKIAETADGDEVFYWIGQPPQEMFSTERFADGSLTYVISGMQAETADYYTGKQYIHAGYLMGEFSFLRKLHLTTGARLEKSKTEVTTELYNLGTNAISDSLVTLEKTDWLPADNSMDKDVDHTINKIKEGAKQSAGTTVVYLDRKNAPPRLFSISQKGEETLLKSYGEENSANAATLARVIRETKELLPSDQFGLVSGNIYPGGLRPLCRHR